MLKKLTIATEPFRKIFEFIQGTSLWLSLLKEKITVTEQSFSINLPSIKTPTQLRLKTSDIEAFCQIFINGELDIKIEHSVDYIIDGGANIRLSAVWFANKFPHALIDSLEIGSNNISVLKKLKTIIILIFYQRDYGLALQLFAK